MNEEADINHAQCNIECPECNYCCRNLSRSTPSINLSISVSVREAGVENGTAEPTFTTKFWGQMLTLQWLNPEKREPNPEVDAGWAVVTYLCSVEVAGGSFPFSVENNAFPCTSTLDTACLCCRVGHSYSWSAFERWPVTSLISFSGMPALKSADAPVDLKLWLVFLSPKLAYLHISAK